MYPVPVSPGSSSAPTAIAPTISVWPALQVGRVQMN
jgi:hypothetical protein